MESNLKLYLFGDQTFDIQPHLRDLLGKRHNPIVQSFLVKAYDAVRAEIYQVPRPLRDDMPRFTCLEDLILYDHGSKRCLPLDMAVTSLYQLGVFLGQEADTWHCPGAKSSVLGLCTGALAAAAVSSSRNSLDLVQKAVDAVTVAFRIGMRVAEVAKRVTSSLKPDQHWSIIVPGSKAHEIIEKFIEHTTLPLTSRPYLSAFAPNGVTVSGPPESLAQLVQGNFKEGQFKSITIYGPYHAPHLYSQFDVNEIIRDLPSSSANSETGHAKLAFLSGAGVKTENQGDFTTLLKDSVGQILLQPIRWGGILEELQTWIQKADGTTAKAFTVIPIGTTADQLIYTALRQTSLRTVVPPPLIATGRNKRSSLEGDASSYPNPSKPKLAIVGMSGRFPGAKDNEAFWRLLEQGLDVHKPVPPLHWDARTHVDPTGTGKNTSATPYGCWLDDPAVFDARFFNISPREAPQIDPAQRLALMTAYEAIEQAGLVPGATPSTRHDRVGVFYGVTSNDWMETNSAQNIDTYFIPGGNRAFIPGRINYFFKFSGPSYAVDTACSSSLASIHLACNSLWRGDVDTAIAGGTNVLTNPDFTAGLDRGHFLSRTGNCKTFDDEADGYCRGEGIGTVILKRLDDALADHDPILGVILGAYTNHSAESESITRPHVGAQRAIFTKILNQAAVDPYTVSYVEMHGTGTQAGDAGEMSSVLDVFAPPPSQSKRGRTSDETLHIGSAKANIGHGEAASGVSSLIKVLLMMQKNTIVPHCGIKTTINRKFPTDLRDRNVRIALKPTPWRRSSSPSKPRRVMVNNFSAAGGNSALLIEDAPATQEPVATVDNDADPRSPHLIALSAKNGVSLQGNLRSMSEFLKENPQVSLGQLSYTTTARRIHHQHRVMFAGSKVEELRTQIETALRDSAGMTRPKSAPKVVFAFTGQGAQYPGMGNQLFQTLSFFRSEICRLDQIAQKLGFPSMLPFIESEEQNSDGFAPVVVQTANVCMQIALSKLWQSWNISPTAVIGHSLGEYAALNTAGVLSDADTIYLVGKRAQALVEKCTRDTHGMLVVRGLTDEIAAVLGDKASYEISCINSPVETVLAGSNEQISVLKDLLTDAGMKTTPLKVPFAFHSSQMDPMLPDLWQLASCVTYNKAKIPVICPLDTQVRYHGNDDDGFMFGPDYLVSHTRKPVNMLGALAGAHARQVIGDQSTILEIGPHPAISGMVKALLGTRIPCLPSAQRGRSAWQVLGGSIKSLYTAGADIAWAEYHHGFKASHKVLPLPAYSWDLKEYWIQYVNDWSLRKGDPPLVVSSGSSRLESTTIHRVVEETHDSADRTRIVVEADIAREDLSPLVQGHEVDGIPLCTPSVYADIALTLGTYLQQQRRQRANDMGNLVDVSDMTISKALILRAGADKQPLQAHAEVDWSSQSATVKFMSFDSKQKLQEHARCLVHFDKDRKALQQALQANTASVKQKMQALRDGIAAETTARFNRPMVYRAIRPLARFHDDYRAIDEIVLNSKTLEASSRLSFGSVKRGGNFHTHPAIIDALTQSCGFTMNCNDNTDLDNEVFMNHGWGSLQLFEEMDFDKVYTTYTRMEEGKDKLWHGDVIIFDGDKVAAYFGQIAIQGVPRRVLKVILSIESGVKSSQKQQAAPAKANQQEHPSIRAGRVPAANGNFAKALAIIAEESGLAVADLEAEGVVFSDVGIDSLLGLTISARFKEELDLDLDFNALFYEYPTVGHLKVFLGGAGHDPTSNSGSDTESRFPSAPRSTTTGATTPDARVDFQRALQIISEESGIEVKDLTDNTSFADAGVDSLLSLVIASRFRDELDLDMSHEQLFLECPTVEDLRKMLAGNEIDSGLARDSGADGLVGNLNTEKVSARLAAEASGPSSESTTLRDRPAHSDPGESAAAAAAAAPAAVQAAQVAQAALEARRAAVDAYVRKYVAGFSAPGQVVSLSTGTAPSGDEKVVLVTGASGSLGSNLVYHLAQLPDVKTVVCLNRENKLEPYLRQQKAMREKGIRFPESLMSKLLVLQTDSSKAMLGLSKSQYEGLAKTVTHLIHNAWPMSAKRPLAGFESQFQTMRNLIDLACDAASQRPESFLFSFQMVSSIGVVGHYGLGNWDGKGKTVVPESRVDIDSVLPNGYGDAKWACERMLDETLHRYPSRFRTMAVRLGQIAGSMTSGYWNPMEHFGFLVKSSQTLNALPDVDGTAYWTPVNQVAAVLSDLVLNPNTPNPYPVYHIENPVGQPWRKLNAILADALGIPNLIPFGEWVERVRTAPAKNNPAATLLEFLDSNYLRMSCGGLVLDVKHSLEHSKTLRAVGPVSEEVVRKYIHIWREIGFIH
ncbi:ketoacyl-synt-domain-containing protein [Parathielavia appendiculata]|uniref:Ketoacyl-synt-domain-containing protein n=1 Tax=Parathielavia appendiculata TaxID=2587402 RepID=A0AAN6Z1N6_9PEZI|nr:ketoacyl-synt-domain-containing protein [Parathielavia appendiculata]